MALLFFDLGARWEWMVNARQRPLYRWARAPVPLIEEAGWAWGPVWTGAENIAPVETPLNSCTVHPEDLRSRKCNYVKKEETSCVQQPFQTVFYFGVLRVYYDIEHNNNGS
jgi:hypothetical protein